MLDSEGDVIGMNTAVAGTLPDGTSAQNIGFAIPVSTIESLLKSLEAGESVVSHGAFIGVEITSNTPALKSEYGFSISSGAVVLSVISGTGARHDALDDSRHVGFSTKVQLGERRDPSVDGQYGTSDVARGG